MKRWLGAWLCLAVPTAAWAEEQAPAPAEMEAAGEAPAAASGNTLLIATPAESGEGEAEGSKEPKDAKKSAVAAVTPAAQTGEGAAAAPGTAPGAPATVAAAETTVTASPAAKATDKPVSVANMTPEQLASLGGFTYSFGLNHSVGHGTFVAPELLADVVGSLSGSVNYNFRGPFEKRYVVSAGASLSYEYTLPDNPTGRRVDWSDLRLGLQVPGLIKLPLGITGSPSVTYTAPITLGSWWQGSAGGLSGRLGFHKSWNEKLQTSLSLGAGTGLIFSQSSGPTRPDDLATLRRDEAGNPVYICRQANTLCDSGWVNSAYNLNAGLGTTWGFMEGWYLSAGLSIGTSFRYAVTNERDEFSSDVRDADGNLVTKTGMGRSDRLGGSVSVSYDVTDKLSLSFNVGSGGPPLTADNKRLRFPFFDWESAVGNSVSYSLSFGGRL